MAAGSGKLVRISDGRLPKKLRLRMELLDINC